MAGRGARGGLHSLPFLIVLAYLFVEYGRPQDWLPPLRALRPGMLVLGAGVLVWLVHFRGPIDTLSKYMLGLFGIMVALVPFSYNPRIAFYTTFDYGLLLFGAVFPIIAFVNSFDRLRILMFFWVWIHVPLALYSVTHKGVGIGSFLGDENDFALTLNMALAYAVALLIMERKMILRLPLLAAIVTMLIAIVATSSRGGFIGLISVAAMLVLRLQKKMVSSVVIGALAMAFVLAAPPSYWKEMSTIRTSTDEDDTGHARFYFWGIAWQMFLDHPLGVGPGNYGFNAPSYETRLEKGRGNHVWGRVSHSLYFTVLPELGVVGAVVFAALVISGVRTRRRIARTCKAALQPNTSSSHETRDRIRWLLQTVACMDVSLVAFLTTGAFLSVLYYPHFWILTAFTGAAGHVTSRVLSNELILAKTGSAQSKPWALQIAARAAEER